MKFLSPEVVLYLYKSTIRPCMEYCCHVWAGAPSCYLELLDKPQKQICRTVGHSLAASLEVLAQGSIYPSLLTGFGMLVFFTDFSLAGFQFRYLVIFLLFSVVDAFGWFWMGSLHKNIQLML